MQTQTDRRRQTDADANRTDGATQIVVEIVHKALLMVPLNNEIDITIIDQSLNFPNGQIHAILIVFVCPNNSLYMHNVYSYKL